MKCGILDSDMARDGLATPIKILGSRDGGSNGPRLSVWPVMGKGAKKRRWQPRAARPANLKRMRRNNNAEHVECMADVLVALGDPIVCSGPVGLEGVVSVELLDPHLLAMVGPTLLLHELLAYIVGVSTRVVVEPVSLRMWAWVVGTNERNSERPCVHDGFAVPGVQAALCSLSPRELPSMRAVKRLRRVLAVRPPCMAAVPVWAPPGSDVEVFNLWEGAVVGGETATALACAARLCDDKDACLMMAQRLPLHAMTFVNWADMGLVLHTFRVALRPGRGALLDATYAVCTAPRSMMWNPKVVTRRDVYRADEYEGALLACDFGAAMAALLAVEDASGVWPVLAKVLPPEVHLGLLAWDADTCCMFTATALAFGTVLAMHVRSAVPPPRLPVVAPLVVQ